MRCNAPELMSLASFQSLLAMVFTVYTAVDLQQVKENAPDTLSKMYLDA